MKYPMGKDLSDGPEGPDRSLLAHCLRLANPDGWALEFGVGSGDTLRMIAEVLPVIGFDSFQGLPEDWRPGFSKGKFAAPPPRGVNGSTIVHGLFEDTVPNYEFPETLSLVHMDADLYSSTRIALDHVPFHSGTIIVFDEFFGYDGAEDHEQRAWAEHVEKYGAEYTVIGHGREQWAVQIR